MIIDQLNMSFIWTKTFFQLFEAQAAQRYPIGFFARCSDYKAKFRGLFSDNTEFTLPWKLQKKNTNWFWKYYFNGIDPVITNPSKLSGIGWNNLVPFRKPLNFDVSLSWSDTSIKKKNVSLEGFFYRHGIALICTLKLYGLSNLEEVAQKVQKARYQNIFILRPDNENSQNLSLTELSNRSLSSLCNDAIRTEEGYTSQPFSVSAVMKGKRYYPYEIIDVMQNNEIHKILEALTTWNPSALPDLKKHKIDIKHQAKDHFLYSHDRARALWAPKLFFAAETQNNYALRWYFRNLVISSMHTQSLTDFLIKANDQSYINGYLSEGIRVARKILNKIERGSKTYRTNSLAAQINQNSELQAALQSLKDRVP